jgi:hypothetical protein
MGLRLAGLAAALLATFASANALSVPVVSQSQCDGCLGSSDADADASATCPTATVSIAVTVTSASCEVLAPGVCDKKPCSATVTRTWNNIDPNTEMDFCSKFPGWPRLCIDVDPNTPGVQGPSSGTGTGTSTINPPVPCGDGNSIFAISGYCTGASGGTVLSATAQVTCSDHCS